MNEQVIDLKGEMSLLNVLLLRSVDMVAIASALDAKRASVGQFLERSPVVVDCHLLGQDAGALDFVELKSLVIRTGLIPVGIRYLPEELESVAVNAGWPLLRAGKQPVVPAPPPAAPVSTETEAADVRRMILIERPVRSGQQIYCPDGDIVVLQQTSAGSELLAGGSVHVYGALRGRVLAGVQGDTSARIFCQRLEAELIAVAGRYRLLDDVDEELKGQAVMVYLENEKLKIVPI